LALNINVICSTAIFASLKINIKTNEDAKSYKTAFGKYVNILETGVHVSTLVHISRKSL
jgi:hypothetical protein